MLCLFLTFFFVLVLGKRGFFLRCKENLLFIQMYLSFCFLSSFDLELAAGTILPDGGRAVVVVVVVVSYLTRGEIGVA